jgi:uncharacterized protein (TIGR02246 family)
VSIEDEVRAFNSTFHAALAANDVDRVVDHFAPEGRFIVPGHPPIVGHDELRAVFQADADRGVETTVKSYTIDEIFEGGSLVVETGSEVVSDRLADGSTSDISLSYVGVYRRGTDGRLSLLVDCVTPDTPD